MTTMATILYRLADKVTSVRAIVLVMMMVVLCCCTYREPGEWRELFSNLLSLAVGFYFRGDSERKNETNQKDGGT